MILPEIFKVIEPASVKISTGSVPVEITDLYPVLETVMVQTARSQPGIGTLVLTAGRDEAGTWPVIDGGYFERWKPIRITADFGTYAEDVIWGYIVKITPEFPQDRGAAKVTIEFQDETIALDRTEVTRTWGDSEGGTAISDNTIVQSVLSDYGHTLDLTSAQGQSRLTLNQDKTDFRFVPELAEAVGYEIRLMFGTMYFGPIALTGEPQAPIRVYAGPDTKCLEFKIDEEAAVPDKVTTASADTGGDGTSTETTLAPDLPILGSESAQEAAASQGVSEFVWRLKQEGDNAPDAAQMLAQAKINESSLSIRAECMLDSTMYGHVLLPGKLVTVDGVGERYGGRFYVDSVEHAFDATGYTQKAVLLKNGINEG